MTQYFHHYEPPTPATELLSEFGKQKKEAKMLKRLAGHS